MVSLLSLAGVAAAFLGLALLTAWLRRLGPREAAADALAAGTAALAALGLSTALYGLVGRAAGSWALIATPALVGLALRLRGRRSLPRALAASAFAVVVVVLWLTLSLRGVHGGWTVWETGSIVATATVAIAAAGCCGWWTKAERRS